jgi:SHO1 osmosensor
VYMLFCIIGVTVTVASDSERTYHVAVSEVPVLLGFSC